MSGILLRRGVTDRTTAAIADVLGGRRRGMRAVLPFAGPAIVASVAYMDPGNFATNIQAGAGYGYGLLWVVLLANLVAMLFQALSARIGIVTGHNLAELCREHFPRPLVWAMWVVSEVAAMATDLAEFLGAAIGLSLLAHLPLLVGMAITGVAVYAILALDRAGFRPFELVITALVGVIGASYLAQVLLVPPDWGQALVHTVVPSLEDGRAVTLAVGIVGATVMPHAIYLHSGLTQSRAPAGDETARKMLIRFSNREVVVALAVAGMINMAMVMTAAAAFHAGHAEVAEIETAYHTLGPLLGAGAASAFLVALLASGLSSSAVGTLAGQIVMQGFLRIRIPIWVRRLVTMIPAFVVVALGADPTGSLVLSQVALSIALPVPMLALLVLSRRRAVMGDYALGDRTFAAGIAAAAVVLALNVVLLLLTAGVAIPGLPT